MTNKEKRINAIKKVKISEILIKNKYFKELVITDNRFSKKEIRIIIKHYAKPIIANVKLDKLELAVTIAKSINKPVIDIVDIINKITIDSFKEYPQIFTEIHEDEQCLDLYYREFFPMELIEEYNEDVKTTLLRHFRKSNTGLATYAVTRLRKLVKFTGENLNDTVRSVLKYFGSNMPTGFTRIKNTGYLVNKNGVILKPSLAIIRGGFNYFGYTRFTRRIENVTKKSVTCHRVVALTFISNPDNKPQVNHTDGVKTNNRKDNLEWNTAKENTAHAIRTGLRNNCGEDSPVAKLTNVEARGIRKDYNALISDFIKYTIDKYSQVPADSDTVYHVTRKEIEDIMSGKKIEMYKYMYKGGRRRDIVEKINGEYGKGRAEFIKESAKKYRVNFTTIVRIIHSESFKGA